MGDQKMQKFDATKINRRSFLGGAALLGGFSPLALQMAATTANAQANSYRALVCLYLDGGLDHYHTMIPCDQTNYAAIVAQRSGITMPPRSALTPLTTRTSQGGRQVAFHPILTQSKRLYDQGKLAVIYGHGNLDEPITRADLEAGRVKLPSAVGSHNDSNAAIHTFGLEGARYGWGGLAMDSLQASNPDNLFASIGVGQLNNPFNDGRAVQMIKADTWGRATNISGLEGTLFGSSVASAELDSILRRGDMTNALDKDYLGVNQRVMSSYRRLGDAFAATQSLAPIPTDTTLPNYTVAWRDNDVVASLRTVLRCIASRTTLNVNRQVFFINMRNFDTHGNMAGDLEKNNFLRLDAALGYFYAALTAMGLENNVTLFTTSEFGRSLKSNGDGTDHGWGGVSFVLGGAVKGGDIYGNLVDINPAGPGFQSINGPPISIPTIANQQYCATLASWLGVAEANLPDIFPNLNRFASTKLGFL